MSRNRVVTALAVLALVGVVFFAGYVKGIAAAGVKTPSTVIHHVTLKWKADVSDADKQKAIDGLKEILGGVPGARNLWVKALKIQPREYSQTFVIEFENEAALKAYAENPKKKAWNDFYNSVRESSFNCVTTN